MLAAFRVFQIIFLIALPILLIFEVQDMIVHDRTSNLSIWLGIACFAMVYLEIHIQRKRRKSSR